MSASHVEVSIVDLCHERLVQRDVTVTELHSEGNKCKLKFEHGFIAVARCQRVRVGRAERANDYPLQRRQHEHALTLPHSHTIVIDALTQSEARARSLQIQSVRLQQTQALCMIMGPIAIMERFAVIEVWQSVEHTAIEILEVCALAQDRHAHHLFHELFWKVQEGVACEEAFQRSMHAVDAQDDAETNWMHACIEVDALGKNRDDSSVLHTREPIDPAHELKQVLRAHLL